MMITGDYHHTGIAVARDVGMLKPQGKVVIIDTVPPVLRQSTLVGVNSLLSCAKASQSSSLKPSASSASQRSFKRSVSFALGRLGAQPSLLSPQRTIKRSVSFAADVRDSACESDRNQGETIPHATAADEVQSHLPGCECQPGEQGTAQLLLPLDFQSAADGHNRAKQTPMVDASPTLGRQTPGASLEGLRFLTPEQETLEASEALHALAEGRLQCAVSGEALEHLLQHHDLSGLETVMRNVVVFSRMKPHQKGQVMDLLGMRGIHQMIQGHTRYIPVGTSFCHSECCLPVWP